MAKASKPKPYPNKSTDWSYMMQAIEPSNREINVAFPDYHPMWVIQSQKKTVSGENFKLLREHLLKMTREQCGAYFRVSKATIQNWETGKSKLPFIAFELMRLVFESVHFRLSNKDWQGWFVNNDGRLVSPDRGNLSFSPHELSFVRETHQVKSMYEAENKKLRAEVEPLRAEIAVLKAASGDDGVLDELIAIEAQLADLASRVSKRKVVPITKNKSTETSQEVKVA